MRKSRARLRAHCTVDVAGVGALPQRNVAMLQRLKGRYIVLLNDSTLPEQVDGIARMLARAHGGRLLATMTHAMRGFGIALPEPAAIALSKHPAVKLVEEDELTELVSTDPGPFDFSATKRPAVPIATSHTSCSWNSVGYYLCDYTNDAFWHLDRLDNQGQIYPVKRYGYNSSGVGVRAYVVDYGVYAAHSEFEGRVEAGANMLVDPDISDVVNPGTTEEPPVAQDGWPATNPCGGWLPDANGDAGHGTGVASVLGGKTVGVVKHVVIVPVKVITCQSEIPKLAVARGLDWIQGDMQNRPGTRAVVSMSFGFTVFAPPNGTEVCEDGAGGFTNCVSAVEHEINELISRNIVVVNSANNQNQNFCQIQTPARMGYGNEARFASTHRTITVGGTMYTGNYVDQRWTCAAQPGGCDASGEFANGNRGSNFGPCVSIFAPAWNINVAGAAGPNSFRTGLGARSGTSWSAPYVAGVVARLLQRYPTLTPRQVWDELVRRANLRWNAPDYDPSATVNTRLVYMPATE